MPRLGVASSIVLLAFIMVIVGSIAMFFMQLTSFTEKHEARPALEIRVGEPGSLSYIVGKRLAEQLRATGTSIDVRVYSSPIEALKALRQKSNVLVLVPADLAYLANAGLTPFSETTKSEVRAIASLYDKVLQIVVRSNSPIRSISDLDGRRVVVGAKGSHEEVLATAVFSVLGVKPIPINANLLRGIEMLRLGEADALVVVSGVPSPAVYQLSTTLPLRVLDLPSREVVEKLREEGFTFIGRAVISRGTYRGQSENVETIAVKTLIVAPKSADLGLIERVTSTLFSKKDSILAGISMQGAYNETVALQGVSVPLHLGALRYYLQKGVSVPGILVPPELAGG